MRRLALALALLCGCSEGAPQAQTPDAPAASGATVRELPIDLREVSGLAMASPTSVFTHNDESAVVQEIDLGTGRPLRRFALGDPPLRADAEGIAATAERVYLITSDGRLLSAPIGADGGTVAYDEVDTGVGAACEIEGLSLAPTAGQLLILCKRAHRREGRGRLTIYAWDLAARTAATRPWLDLDMSETLGEAARDFAPSSLEWDAQRRRLIVVSAHDGRLMMLDEHGRILENRLLDRAAHPQAEGVTITAAGALVIADEGGRRQPGRLTIYPAGR